MSDDGDDGQVGFFLIPPEENEIRISVTADGKVLIQLPVEDGQVVAVLAIEDAISFLESFIECLDLAKAIHKLPGGMAIMEGGTA